MTKLTTLHSGLVIPTPPKEPEKPFKALEVQGEEERKIVAKCLGELINNVGRTGGIVLGDKKIVQARRELLLYVVQQLLGDNFEFEEWC
jgi:hypothetical protein